MYNASVIPSVLDGGSKDHFGQYAPREKVDLYL